MHLLYISQVDLAEVSGQARFEQSFLSYLSSNYERHQLTFEYIGITPSVTDINLPKRKRLIQLRKSLLGFISFQFRLFIEIFKSHRQQKFDAVYLRFHPLMVAPFFFTLFSGASLHLRTGPITQNLKIYKKSSSKLLNSLVAFNCWLNYKKARSIFVVTEQIRDWVITNFTIPPQKVILIPNGVDTEKFNPTRFDAKPQSIQTRFLLVCTLHPSQGIEALIDSFKILQAKTESCILEIAGAGEEAYRQSLLQKIQDTELEGRVRLLGAFNHNEIPKVIYERDIMLLPVLQEELNRTGSSSLKLYEYLAMNKFVVASRHKDHQFLEDNNIGLLYPAGNSTGLADSMYNSINKYAEVEKSGKIRTYCLTNCSANQCFESYINHIKTNSFDKI